MMFILVSVVFTLCVLCRISLETRNSSDTLPYSSGQNNYDDDDDDEDEDNPYDVPEGFQDEDDEHNYE